MKLRNKLAVALALTGAALGYASDFEARPIGILHADAATYMGEMRKDFTPGVALPEIRIGADAEYRNWKARILVGFANNKVAAKDVYLQYNINDNNYIRGGHFVHQYGYQNSTAAYEKVTMIAPGPETAFNAPQRLGLSYVHADSMLMATASVYTPDDVINTGTGQKAGKIYRESFGLKSRWAVHPFTDGNRFIGQMGLSGLFETPQSYWSEGYRGALEPVQHVFGFSVPYPTKVDNVTASSVTLNGCRNRWQVSPDLLVARGRLALEGQYFYTRVNYLNEAREYYQAQGFYVTLRGVLAGEGYRFAPQAAGLAVPKPGTLEGLLTMDYTDFAGFDTGGEKVFNYAAVFNYYINKYMVFRLRAGFTRVKDDNQLYYSPDYVVAADSHNAPDYACPFGEWRVSETRIPPVYSNLFTLQARFQFIF